MRPPMFYQTHNYTMSVAEPSLLLFSALESHLLPALVLAAVYGSLAINNDYFCTFELIRCFNNFSLDTCKQNDQKTICNLRKIPFQ